MSRRQDYLLSDIARGIHRPYRSTDAATLTPTISASAVDDSSIFHRALHAFNLEHFTQRCWDELTVSEQDEVRGLMRELQRRRHVCR